MGKRIAKYFARGGASATCVGDAFPCQLPEGPTNHQGDGISLEKIWNMVIFWVYPITCNSG